jgi:hypothetical protein
MSEQDMTNHLVAQGWSHEQAEIAARHYHLTARAGLETLHGLEACAANMYPTGSAS